MTVQRALILASRSFKQAIQAIPEIFVSNNNDLVTGYGSTSTFFFQCLFTVKTQFSQHINVYFGSPFLLCFLRDVSVINIFTLCHLVFLTFACANSMWGISYPLLFFSVLQHQSDHTGTSLGKREWHTCTRDLVMVPRWLIFCIKRRWSSDDPWVRDKLMGHHINHLSRSLPLSTVQPTF